MAIGLMAETGRRRRFSWSTPNGYHCLSRIKRTALTIKTLLTEIMKKIIIVLLGLLISGGATAEWTRVGGGENGSSDIYIDIDTIRRDGDKLKLWTMHNFKPLKGKTKPTPLSNKAYWEFNCKEETHRLLAMTIYSGKGGSGSIVDSDHNTNRAWEPIIPDSIGRMLFDASCDETIGNRWVLVVRDDSLKNVSLYFDYSSIRKVGERVRMWQMLDFRSEDQDPSNGYSSKFYREYDCKEQQIRTILQVEYLMNMGIGKNKLHNEATPWIPLLPGQFNELWEKACNTRA
jgi:hypothetical protein